MIESFCDRAEVITAFKADKTTIMIKNRKFRMRSYRLSGVEYLILSPADGSYFPIANIVVDEPSWNREMERRRSPERTSVRQGKKEAV